MVKGLIKSPTGKGVRSDSQGDGQYYAPRGKRRHQGIDFVCDPGQVIICPINNAEAIRMAYPYANTREYEGVLLRNNRFEILLFYVEINPDIFHKTLFQGAAIGIAQDISQRYTDKMTPHIHLQIDSADPELFLNPTEHT